MRFTFFHTEYGIPSGPGADQGELLERASLISSLVRGGAEGFFVRRPLLGRGLLGGKKVIQECVVDCYGVGSIREGGKAGGLLWGDQLFGCPDVVRGGFCEEIGPVGSLRSFYGLEIAEFNLSCCGVEVGGPQFFGLASSFCELLPESGEEKGPPGFGLRGGA